jgi:hypothetical protein
MSTPEVSLSPADDGLHPASADAAAIETLLFSFYVPERRLGGWLYTFVRPALRTVGGGVWIWDGSASLPWEVPYFALYNALAMPDHLDLRDAELPTGLHLRVTEPLNRYQLRYHDEGLVDLELDFTGIAPHNLAYSRDRSMITHYEQPGRVTGRLELHGEEIAVNCVAMRDRTWSRRAETEPHRVSYCWGLANSGDGFLAICAPDRGQDTISRGYLIRDGHQHQLVEGRRIEEREPDHSWIRRVIIDAVDSEGRALHVEGVSHSRLALPMPGVARMLVWTSLMSWDAYGVQIWGEDQDCWSYAQWASLRRAAPTTGGDS